MSKYYIVWNSNKSEGFVTNDKGDAEDCRWGKFGAVYSSIGYEFYEAYGEDDLHLEEIEL